MQKQASFNRSVVSANALAEAALVRIASGVARRPRRGIDIRANGRRTKPANIPRTGPQGLDRRKNAIRSSASRVESSVATATVAVGAVARATASATANRLAENAASALPRVKDPAFAASAAAPKARKHAKAARQSARPSHRPQRQAHRRKSK